MCPNRQYPKEAKMHLIKWFVLSLFLILECQGGSMMEKVAFKGWQNCVRLTNGRIELVVTTDVGPRIIRFGFVEGQNLFRVYDEHAGLTGGEEWHLFGGHRLWHAPEAKPRTYAPDNSPVKYTYEAETLKLCQTVEALTGIEKQMEIHLSQKEDRITVLHRLINRNQWEVELAPWCLSVMAPGGHAIIPQEPFRSHTEELLPARPMVLWYYTNLADPRWTWGTKYIQLQQDPTNTKPQKIGLRNAQQWAAYQLGEDLFIKTFPFDPAATYPDFGCNNEFFTNEDMLEVESVGPLTRLAPNASVELEEVWSLHKKNVGKDEAGIDAQLLPLVKK
jgi:hypothetical protein